MKVKSKWHISKDIKAFSTHMFCAACEPISEEHLTNGHITYLNNPIGNYGRYDRGAKLRHVCDYGFSPTGWRDRTCIWSGRWTGWTGECV